MTKKTNDEMVKKALRAIVQEDLSSFIDCEGVSDEDLKKALLTAVDINVLQEEYQSNKKLLTKEK